ncbi:MAG TPA: protein kinase, partial [Myxococcales bacterium]|nr:protein kinase [Myxococcales bacterium]
MTKKTPGEAPGPPEEQDGPTEAPPEDDPAFADLLRKVAQAPSVDPRSVSDRSADRAAQESLAGKQLAHFQVLERIGEGGMGVIYRATDERLRRTVALKVLPPRHAADRERVARLWREAQSAAAVNHPHIASIYELGEAQGLSFIAMEYVAGKSLRSYCKGRPLLIGEAVHFARQVAEGLARAHEAGIVHRDLKPDNVMITPDRRVKILDFGLAKLMSAGAEAPSPQATPGAPGSSDAAGPGASDESSPTRDGVVLGTPVYMSPEQEKGEPKLDARADVYSFGVMLFEMLTGTPPARHGDPRAHLLYMLEGPGKDVDPSLVVPLEQVVLRCIESNPRHRYPDGAAVLEALRAVPISTGMDLPPMPFNVHTTTRQRFFWVLAGLVVFLTGCIIAANYVHKYLVARDRRLAAEENRRKQARKPAEHRLTFNTPEDPILDAVVSPDGATLAFVDSKGAHLRTLKPESTRSLKLPDTVPPPQFVTWMPGGKEVVLTARRPGADESVLVAVSLDGQVRELGRGKVERPQVSPDGKQVAFISHKGISVAPLSLEKPRVLVEKLSDEALYELHWSPDGKRLLFVHEIREDEGDRAYLETVDPVTSNRQLLLEDARLVHGEDNGAVVWAPDGRIIFALEERPPSEPGFTLWTVSLDPTTGLPRAHARMLSAWVGSSPGMLSASREGLAYARFEQQTDVYLIDLDGSGRAAAPPRRLTMSERNERPSGWSPDGKSILYVSDQDGS